VLNSFTIDNICYPIKSSLDTGKSTWLGKSVNVPSIITPLNDVLEDIIPRFSSHSISNKLFWIFYVISLSAIIIISFEPKGIRFLWIAEAISAYNEFDVRVREPLMLI
jgi:hypothetical protein